MDPTSNGENGRTSKGRFAQGNPGGPGNPYVKRVSILRAALLRALDEDAIQMIAVALVNEAKTGDVAAAKLLLSYAVGQPPESVPEPDETPQVEPGGEIDAILDSLTPAQEAEVVAKIEARRQRRTDL